MSFTVSAGGAEMSFTVSAEGASFYPYKLQHSFYFLFHKKFLGTIINYTMRRVFQIGFNPNFESETENGSQF